MSWRNTMQAENSPRKLLAWTAVLGLIFGLISFGEIAEDWLRIGRNSLHPHKASGDIVLVKVDDASLRAVGRWPWPRRYHAEMIERLTEAGAKRIFFDVMFENASDAREDRLLGDAIERSGRVTLAIRIRSGHGFRGAAVQNSPPLASFTRHAELATISAHYNYQNSVWKLPYAIKDGSADVPSYAAKLANVKAPANEVFPLDYSTDPHSIPAFSAVAVLDGSVDPRLIRGKDVVIGVTSDSAINDQYFLPGWGKMGGSYIQIIGAETLKAGEPLSLGWLPAFAFAVGSAIVGAYRRRRLHQNAVFGAAAIALLAFPIFLEARLVFIDITPGLFVIVTTAASLAWRRFRDRGLVNAISGLPNLSALHSNRLGRNRAIIAARVMNYAEIIATLPPNSEPLLIDQIVARLRIGKPERTLYQGDGGIFAWFEEARLPFANHIEALHALFRAPAIVATVPVDLSVSFGVEIGSGRSLANRLASALVAADEAAHDGLKWKYHEPGTPEDASWKLSMLSQLDAAVDKGEVWVAYQPKLDLATRTIIGAEALARWTHPKKGPIAASEFVAAAEQHDRIGKLTDFVLEQAITAAAVANRRHHGFGIAVNLSARLLNDQRFALRLRAMLARHGVAPQTLTLELTETAALTGSGGAIEILAALRDLGVGIAIDDYGTGLSTLEYLKKIPASEIKIDQSFVKGMLDNRSDRLMVQSTIGLAHSLGRKVVAEGVESAEVLESLREMQCDMAQGYIIGRPMSLEALVKRVGASKRTRAA